MDDNRVKRNRMLGELVIKGLASRNMEGYYAETKEEALQKALEIIPEGSSVSWGGTMSAAEIGLIKAMCEGNYKEYNRKDAKNPEEKRKMELAAYDCDYFLASANAITQDGVIVNIDGHANRVSAIAYGPRNVLMIVGMNKVVKSVDDALSRARNEAAPINAQRFDLDTPCCKTGACFDCKNPDTICCQIMITRYSKAPNRIKVILVNDDLGF
ncbi:lactate utilization protein [Faecalicatena contorta]|uniref:lactate utilization protein n=1 Tax=Faecalicatena contorta TaxID=39482 RepID=UPI001F2A9E07|nr:lactate utilization protein [Faecalicatena contorta]MCF2555535.1 lactate utilization protein [Faecalicatena contorta]MCF2679903.1 lactate utilization protein [Faecalicatena contorta]